MARGGYNNFYRIGRLCMQITLDEQPTHGFYIHITPAIGFTIKNLYLLAGVSLEWIFGTINIGIMNKGFVESEITRIERLKEYADKSGITLKQQRLRYRAYK